MKHSASVKEDNEQKQLEVAIRDLRKELKQQEEKRTEIEVKYKNLQKIHECTKKENKIYEAEILKLKHERDTGEEVMKPYVMLTSTKYKSDQRQIKNNKYRNLIQYWKKNRV